jgi:hypothetical protein
MVFIKDNSIKTRRVVFDFNGKTPFAHFKSVNNKSLIAREITQKNLIPREVANYPSQVLAVASPSHSTEQEHYE